jgi:hypothetical protein
MDPKFWGWLLAFIAILYGMDIFRKKLKLYELKLDYQIIQQRKLNEAAEEDEDTNPAANTASPQMQGL